MPTTIEDVTVYSVPEVSLKKIVNNPEMRIFIESLALEVGAGFIPARSGISEGLRAGINPAPTRK